MERVAPIFLVGRCFTARAPADLASMADCGPRPRTYLRRLLHGREPKAPAYPAERRPRSHARGALARMLRHSGPVSCALLVLALLRGCGPQGTAWTLPSRGGRRTIARSAHQSSRSDEAAFRPALLDVRQLSRGPARVVDSEALAKAYPGVDFAVPSTVEGALCKFASSSTPQFIAFATVLPLALRFGLLPSYELQLPQLQPFSGVDVAVASAVAMFWVVQEWLIHDVLLHSEAEWLGKSIHHGHHMLPYYHISIDELPIAVAWFAAATAAIAVLFGHLGLGAVLTAVASYSAMGGLYEFSHYLAHTRVPLEGHWAHVRAHHQRHHLRNDGYWLGFTLPAVDTLMGTDPSPMTVPRRAPGDPSPRRLAEPGPVQLAQGSNRQKYIEVAYVLTCP